MEMGKGMRNRGKGNETGGWGEGSAAFIFHVSISFCINTTRIHVSFHVTLCCLCRALFVRCTTLALSIQVLLHFPHYCIFLDHFRHSLLSAFFAGNTRGGGGALTDCSACVHSEGRGERLE